MNLQILEDRALEIERAIRELLNEIHRMKQAESVHSPETANSRQAEVANRMRVARDAMPPLDGTVKDLVEDGCGREVS